MILEFRLAKQECGLQSAFHFFYKRAQLSWARFHWMIFQLWD